MVLINDGGAVVLFFAPRTGARVANALLDTCPRRSPNKLLITTKSHCPPAAAPAVLISHTNINARESRLFGGRWRTVVACVDIRRKQDASVRSSICIQNAWIIWCRYFLITILFYFLFCFTNWFIQFAFINATSLRHKYSINQTHKFFFFQIRGLLRSITHFIERKIEFHHTRPSTFRFIWSLLLYCIYMVCFSEHSCSVSSDDVKPSSFQRMSPPPVFKNDR